VGVVHTNRTGALGEADTRQLFDQQSDLRHIVKLQSDETDKWVTEFNSGIALLGDMIKSPARVWEKAVEAARASVAAQTNGAIEVDARPQGGREPVTRRHRQ